VLGVGVGAHSGEAAELGAPYGARRSNERDLAAWLRRIQHGDPAAPPFLERLDARAAQAEAAFLALRTREGLAGGAFEREFGVAPEVRWPDLPSLQRAGLLTREGDRWQLTRRGWLLSDSVFERLV
jgi:coproporphyrinogen III oxidase-like Fe-S oxidoreductase